MTSATDLSTLALPGLSIEAPRTFLEQDTGFDIAALLTIGLIIGLFHILAPALREDSQTGQAFSAMSLRQVITIVFGFLTIALAAGENNKSDRMKAFSLPAIRWLVRGIVGFYLIYAVLLLVSLIGFISIVQPLFAFASTLTSVIVYILILGATIAGNDRNITHQGQPSPGTLLRWVASALLGAYLLFTVAFIFFGLEIATDSILPATLELAALASVIALWQPWNRIVLYRQQLGKVLPPILIFVGVLVLWELIVKAFDIQQFLLPAPSVIIDTVSSIYPRLVNQGWLTFQNALWGFGIVCGAGVMFVLILGRVARFSMTVLTYAIAVNSIPIIAFAPITNAWFGIFSQTSKIIIVAILTFFPTMINTVRGLTSVDPASLELMRSLAASEFDIYRKVRLPVALPFIFNGLKISTSLSMIGAIVAEYFGGPTSGLGVQISSNAMRLRFSLVWSQIIIASALGIIFYFVVSLSERLIMPWHITFRPRAE